ncbi:hypothetical protein [Amycolatopsis sp. NPDC051071]|uniref:hypothetical protein n=1 Tax=Amycolatopsis sp. NPDC051071 TaxID=3154637 RepID=UPI00343D28F1
MLKTTWKPGPAEARGSVLVSVTDFASDRRLDLPGIYRAGRRLAALWPDLDGAVGHWLWVDIRGSRSGSVSLWRDAGAMRAFIGLPVHVDIMRTYRKRGTIRATTWTADDPELSAVWREAVDFLRVR